MEDVAASPLLTVSQLCITYSVLQQVCEDSVKAMQKLYAGIDADPSIPELDHCFYDAEHFGVAAFVWKDNKLQLVGTIL